MNGKRNDFFLTLTTFFATLLPGAMLALLVVSGWPHALAPLPSGLSGSFGAWFVLFVVAYLAGQVLYALGDWLVDPLYDWMDLGFQSPNRRSRFRALEDSVRAGLFAGMNESLLAKTRAYVLARGEQAWMVVEQADADSKFFRAVTLVAAWGVPIAVFHNLGWRLGTAVAATVLVSAWSLVFHLTSCGGPWSDQPAGFSSDWSAISKVWARFDSWLCRTSPNWFGFSYAVLAVCLLWLAASAILTLWGSWGGLQGESTAVLSVDWALMLVAFFRYSVRRADRDWTSLEAALELAGPAPGKPSGQVAGL